MNFKSIKKQSGVALLAVLAVSVALSLLIASATVMMQRQLTIAQDAKELFFEKAAVHKKTQELSYLLATQRITRAGISTGLRESGSKRIDGRFTSTLTGDEIRVDGLENKAIVDGVDVSFSIQAMDGLIPINTSSNLWLKQWLSSNGLNTFEITKFVDRLADYADENDWSRPAGAEKYAYASKAMQVPTNFLLQRCTEIFNVIEAQTVIDKYKLNLKQCSLNRSASVNINAMPQSLVSTLFGRQGQQIYRARRQGKWLLSTDEARLTLDRLNNVNENYITVISNKRFIIKGKSKKADTQLDVERGANNIKPLEIRIY